MNFMKKKNKKGFTILELLVVVAIIAILAVIAIPQFMGAIDKSRVSAQVADLASVSKAVVMYNFDTSKYPATAQGGANATDGWINATSNALLADQDTDSVTASVQAIANYNGPYLTTYPAKNKWGGDFTYEIVGATPDTDQAAAGLATGQIVIKLTSVPNSQLVKMDVAADSTAGVATGTFRLGATPATTTVGYYVIR